MNKTVVVGIVVAVVLLLGGIFVLSNNNKPNAPVQLEQNNQSPSSFTLGQKAPDFTLKDFDGKDVRLSDFYGKKAVILDFWAGWCPFCVDEMPNLQKAQDQYKDNLVMIGVHRTDSGESIATGKKFADERGVKYLLVAGTSEIYRAATKGITAMPVAVFIDKNGTVVDIKLGPKTEAEIKDKVEKLIQ